MIDAGIGANSALADNYVIDNSIQSKSVSISNPPRFNRTNSGTGNRKTFTISFWHKKGRSSHSNGVSYTFINSIRNETGKYPGLFIMDTRPVDTVKSVFTGFFCDEDANNVQESNMKTVASYNDHSAWYHIVLAYDTTQSAVADRRSMYVNGVEQTMTYNQDLPQHQQSSWNDDTLHCIGAYEYNLPNPTLGGYMAEVHNIDGLKLDASYFGKFDASGIWKPKEYTGAYGTNGFRLQFKETGTGQNASGLGADTSGNDHHFATVGFTAANQATDTPTNNFCTLNRLWTGNASYVGIIDDGATTLRYSSGTKAFAKASMGVTNGKWYWEAMPNGTIGSQYLGIATGYSFTTGTASSQNYNMNIGAHGAYYSYSGSLSETTGAFTALTTSNVIGVALNLEDEEIKYYKDGSLILTRPLLSAMQGETIFPYIMNYENRSFNLNFGGYTINTISSAATDENGYGTFEYAPPSGYYSICTKNLAEYG